MRVLYVEDDRQDADLARRDLARHAPHIQLEVATTLGEARARLAKNTGYDLVLADLYLPDGSGLDLLGEIREQALPLAVVILTAWGDEEMVVAALKAGADDYLAKREDYLTRLPASLETALARFRAEAARKARPLRVLYVERHPADADLTHRHIARHAPYIRLDVVHSAEQVMEHLPRWTAESCPYDVLLVDYRLPGLNALELLKVLHDERHLDLPVVLVTGQGNEEVAAQALRLGAADYRVKHPGYLFELPAALENAYHRVQLVREQAALRESEARFRRLAENAQDLIYRYEFVPRRGFAYVSPAAMAMTGYTPEEHYADPDLGFKVVHPDDRCLLEAATRGEVPSDQLLTLRWIRKDGTVIWTGQRNVPVYDDAGTLIAIEGIARDVTERNRTQELLHLSAQRLSLATESAGIGIWNLDLVHNVLTWDERMYELYGIRMEDCTGSDEAWGKGVHPEDLPAVRAQVEEAIAGKKDVHMQFRVVWPDGQIRFLQAHAVVQRAPDGTPLHMIGVNWDVTHRERAADDLRASLQEKELLLRELYHRTKNNMQVISAMLALQAGFLDDVRVHEIMRQTQNRIQSMALVHEKLYQSQDLSSVNIYEYAADLAQLLIATYRVASNSVGLVFEMEPISMLIDIAMPCGLILNELLANVLEHAFPDNRPGEIRIGLHRTGPGELLLKVSDNGVGVPEGFDFRNTGTFGLQMVTSIAEYQLQGTVTFETEGGLTCRVRFRDDLYHERV